MKKPTQFKLGQKKYEAGQARQEERRCKCQKVMEKLKPVTDFVQTKALDIKQIVLDQLEEERNDLYSEYPFDDGWKCIIF